MLYMSDGKVPYNLKDEDVELARFFLIQSEDLKQTKKELIEHFRVSGKSIGESIAIVFCAAEQEGVRLY